MFSCSPHPNPTAPRGRSGFAIFCTRLPLSILVVTPLLWFHSYHRNTVEEFVDVLRLGPAPPPAGLATPTKQLELNLAVAPARVYCFLGRTSDAFGDCALAFRTDLLAGGEVSPFDTGGLVRHILPVRGWPQAQQRDYLESYSWPDAQLEALLPQYPGISRGSIERYLNVTQPPLVAGPHAIWTGRVAANIWSANPDWRSWTWEGRWPNQISLGASLVAWTCSPALFPQILDCADRATSPAAQDWFNEILKKRIDGGVGNMVAVLRASQVPS
jgi:hypothetical protein